MIGSARARLWSASPVIEVSRGDRANSGTGVSAHAVTGDVQHRRRLRSGNVRGRRRGPIGR